MFPRFCFINYLKEFLLYVQIIFCEIAADIAADTNIFELEMVRKFKIESF